MQATGQPFIETPSLNLMGYPKVPCFKAAESAISEAVVADGGNGYVEVEISMMLDITGSMDGSKIRDLKDAAKDLIDIVLIQETRKSRIALVPFSEAINIEPNWAAEVASNGLQQVKDGKTKYYLDPQCATERTGSDAPPTHGIKMEVIHDDEHRGRQRDPAHEPAHT
jgi:hypothetical protein